MAETEDPHTSQNLIQNLFQTLRHLTDSPYPVLESPRETKKRASVALIIRIQPGYSHWPPPDTSPRPYGESQDRLSAFFSQDWVKHGRPEVLFIRRASRKGDRWTGHVALPGGNRDPEDEDDVATAIREAFEEVGVDLKSPGVMAAGNLPQRVVTARWGSRPIMVLCPYVFLLTEPKLPPMRLQPTEVGSAHWVPISMLLLPQTRVYEYQDVGGAENPGGSVRKLFGRYMLGSMLFAAIRLVPAESMYADVVSEVARHVSQPRRLDFSKQLRSVKAWLYGDNGPIVDMDRPLKLWGLTLGVVSDLLELLPPHDALELWMYPTFSPPDLQLVIWAMSRGFRKDEKLMVITNGHDSPDPNETASEAQDSPDWLKARWKRIRRFPGAVASGLGSIAYYNGVKRGTSADAVMLVGYYEILRRAIQVTLIGRSTILLALSIALWRRYRRNA